MAVATPAPPLDTIPDSRHRGIPEPKVLLHSHKSRGVVSQPEDRVRSREITTPFLLDRDVCLVENVDEVPWAFKYDRRTYTIEPGKEGLVPFPALVNALGDPRSVKNEQTRFRTENGETGIILTRHESIRTLFSRYAIENEDMQELINFAPRVVVKHQETGQVIPFPAQDPDHQPWPVPQNAQPGREGTPDHRLLEELSAQNKAQGSEIAELREMVANLMEQKAPQGVPDPAAGAPVQPAIDPLADALIGSGDPGLGGAPVDTGPGSSFG